MPESQTLIERLSIDTLDSAISLRDKIFSNLTKCEKETLEASLDIENEKYRECLQKNGLTYLEYFIIRDKEKNKVIGLTGLYEENHNNKECWLGWFCVDEAYRKKRLGKSLLDFSIKRAKELNKQYLNLYTYDSEEYLPAIKLYENNDFVKYDTKDKDIYYKMALSPVVTKHMYVDRYPIKKTDKYLILGTIHPHANSKLDFFYGNAKTFWNILSDATKQEFNTLDDILKIFNQYNIGITDMILECTRDDKTLTKDSDLHNLKLNTDVKNQILNSDIETIFFTSAFGKNNAAKLFFYLFELNTQVPDNWNETYEFNIVLENKKIKCIVLLSPSGASNIGISNSKLYKLVKDEYDRVYEKPVKQFKIDFYKSKFEEVFSANKTLERNS